MPALAEECNNCGERASHRCDYHLSAEDKALGIYMYHCPRHLCPWCERLEEQP